MSISHTAMKNMVRNNNSLIIRVFILFSFSVHCVFLRENQKKELRKEELWL